METRIKRKLTANQIEGIFDLREHINIKYFETVTPADEKKVLSLSTEEEYHTIKINYNIKIRHNEDENPRDIINRALNIWEEQSTFIVNKFTTITNFKRLEKYQTLQKFGKDYKYEEFTGCIDYKKVKGLICLADHQIYGLEYIK